MTANPNGKQMYAVRLCLIAILITIVCTMNQTTEMNTQIKLCAWNMGCHMASAKPYITKLMTHHSIVALSEHGLYNCERHKLASISPDFECLSKSSVNLNDANFGNIVGHGGCAILWNKSLSSYIRPLPDLGTDRICGIQLSMGNRKYLILSVYMPHQTCYISNFGDELNVLENIICEYSQMGEICIIGDVNVSLGIEYGKRGTRTNANGKRMMNMMLRYDMHPIDLIIGEGPRWTYTWANGKTYIDHVFVSDGLKYAITKCNVIEDEIANVSDHLPIAIEIQEYYSATPRDMNARSQVAWHKMTPGEINDKYTLPLEVMLQTLLTDISTDMGVSYTNVNMHNIRCDINALVEKVQKCIETTSKSLPHVKFSKALKPYWDSDLKSLSKQEKNARWEWVQAGRPREADHPLNKSYKEAKKEFRKVQRQKAFVYEKESMEELSKSQEIDQRFFWYLINKSKGKTRVTMPIHDDSGELLTNVNDIRENWTDYFEKLYQFENEKVSNIEFKLHVDNTIKELNNLNLQDTDLDGGPVIEEEFKKHVHKLKKRKAAGWDNVSSEHLQYGGPILNQLLTYIMNIAIRSENIPEYYKRGLIVPLPKPGKDPTYKDQNRGITLLPVMYKLLEMIIIDREREWFTGHDIVDELQGAGQTGCSSLHTSLILREAIDYNVRKGESVYIALLDIQKAFDTVWINGLLYKMYELGVNMKTLRIIFECFENFKSAVLISGEYGRWFNPERGVHQGAPLSMYLYQIFMNDLLKQIKKCDYGLHMNAINVSCPAYADDVTPGSIHKYGLNHMLDIAYRYSKLWLYDYSPTKCAYMIWGKDKSPNIPVILGKHELKRVNSCKHMGVYICENKCMDGIALSARIGSCRKSLLAFRGVGSYHVPASPTVMSKVYNSVCLTRMLYGIELIPLNQSSLNELEHAHIKQAKIIQGLPQNIATPAPLAPVGWLSIKANVALSKILFLIRILLLPCDNIYKRIALYMLTTRENLNEAGRSNSPILDMWHQAEKYDILNIVNNIINGESNSYPVVKKQVKLIIKEHEHYEWAATCLLYHNLWLYSDLVQSVKLHTWWTVTQKLPHIFKQVSCVMAVIMGGQPRGLQRNFESSTCKLCTMNCTEDPLHVIFKCAELSDVRHNKMSKMYSCMPRAMYNDLLNMAELEKAHFILSPMRSKYIPEWNDIYMSIASMIFEIYEYRAKKYDDIQAYTV